MHIPPIHASCSTWRFTVIHAFFPVVEIAPATVASRVTPTTPTTADNIATPIGPQPSSTGNITV